MTPRSALRSHQQGNVVMLTAISLAVLIGFLGIVIDLGRLFVTKTELQSAVDACALAAAAELRPGVVPADPQAINRAVSAALTAGNRNDVEFQSSSVSIGATDVYFSDHLSNNSTTFPFGYVSSAAANPATAKYAMCARSQGGITTWFIQVLQSFVGATSTPDTVSAWATATQKSAQISCALPIGACMLPAGNPSNPYAGLVVGQWLSSKLSESATGSFDWIDFSPPGGGAQELADIIKGQGQCSLPATGQMVGEQGNKTSLDKAWNTRFGLYKGSDNATTAPPDFSGYAYTTTNWPSKSNVFGGTSPTGALNFQTARASHLSYQGGAAVGLSLLPPSHGYTNSSPSDLASKGADRRLVTVPVVDCSAWAASNPQQVPVLGYACVLVLHPMTQDDDEVWLEYRGASNDPSSPCNTSGLAGGTAGPLVPALVH